MSIALIDLETLLGETIGALRPLVTSGGGSTTTIVDVALQDLFLTDTALPTWWGRVLGSPALYETRRFTGKFDQTSGTATVSRAYGGTIASATPWELWSINPEDIRASLKRAASLIYPRVFKRTVIDDIIVNNILKNPVFSERLNALFFDGSGDADDTVNIPRSSQIENVMDGAGGTLEAWIIAESDGEGDLGRILSKGGVELLMFDEFEGSISFRFRSLRSDTAGVWNSSSRVLTIGRPHHVAVTFSTDGVTNNPILYVDGEVVTITEAVAPIGTRTSDEGNNQLIGNVSGGSAAFDGQIWNVRMWNYIRSAQQIKDSYKISLRGDEPGLVALYRMQEGAGTILRDETRFHNNGVVTEAAWQELDAFTQWEESGSPTITVETERVFFGKYSLKMVAGASAGQYTQTPFANLADLSGNTVTAKVRVWTAAATTARIRIDWDGSTIISGEYHSGSSDWQELSVSGQVPTDATQVKVILETIAGGTAYFDLSSLDIGRLARYPVPELQTLNFVSQQISPDDPYGNYLSLGQNGRPIPRRLLRVEGMAPLSIPDLLTDTVEVEGKRADYLVAVAARELYRMLRGRALAGTVKEAHLIEQNMWADVVSVMENDPRSGIKMSMAAEMSRAWNVDKDQDGLVLVFTNLGRSFR